MKFCKSLLLVSLVFASSASAMGNREAAIRDLQKDYQVKADMINAQFDQQEKLQKEKLQAFEAALDQVQADTVLKFVSTNAAQLDFTDLNGMMFEGINNSKALQKTVACSIDLILDDKVDIAVLLFEELLDNDTFVQGNYIGTRAGSDKWLKSSAVYHFLEKHVSQLKEKRTVVSKSLISSIFDATYVEFVDHKNKAKFINEIKPLIANHQDVTQAVKNWVAGL